MTNTGTENPATEKRLLAISAELRCLVCQNESLAGSHAELANDLRTASAKGLTSMRALVGHGIRNAAVPVVTVLGLQLATLLIGAVVIERVFVVPGLGSLLLDAVGNRDLIVVQDVVMVLVVAVLVVNFIVDLLYLAIDPRLRTGAR